MLFFLHVNSNRCQAAMEGQRITVFCESGAYKGKMHIVNDSVIIIDDRLLAIDTMKKIHYVPKAIRVLGFLYLVEGIVYSSVGGYLYTDAILDGYSSDSQQAEFGYIMMAAGLTQFAVATILYQIKRGFPTTKWEYSIIEKKKYFEKKHYHIEKSE